MGCCPTVVDGPLPEQDSVAAPRAGQEEGQILQAFPEGEREALLGAEWPAGGQGLQIEAFILSSLEMRQNPLVSADPCDIPAQHLALEFLRTHRPRHTLWAPSPGRLGP